jgi:hypothetical protein
MTESTSSISTAVESKPQMVSHISTSFAQKTGFVGMIAGSCLFVGGAFVSFIERNNAGDLTPAAVSAMKAAELIAMGMGLGVLLVSGITYATNLRQR